MRRKPVSQMKNLKATVSAASLLIGVAVAHGTANSVVLLQQSYSYDVGGEFNANTTQNFLPQYNPAAIVGTGFETFCIETTVDFYPGQTYTYTLGLQDSLGRDLTKGAAYLYQQFSKGVLADYDYTSPSLRNADAGALQAAIWWFQGEQTYGGYPNPIIGNVFFENALSHFGGWNNAEEAVADNYGVEILQMWGNDHTAAQNQLILVPDGATTAGLLSFGFVAMAAVRRRSGLC
jgi:hypothetical protein